MIGRWNKPPVVEEQQPRGFDDFELQLGDLMRGERATLGKSLLDVQRELKIKATYIAAIENTDPSVFETQGFIAGYVRSYARYLQLDPEWAFERFCAESGFAVAHGMSPDASSSRKVSAATPQSRLADDPFADPNAFFLPHSKGTLSHIEPGAVGSLLVLAALIGAIGYGGWSVLQEIQKVQIAPVDQAPGVIADVAALTGDTTQTVDLDQVAQLQVPSAEALDRLYRPQALDTPVLVPRDGPIASLDPRSTGSLAAPIAEDETLLDDIQAVLADTSFGVLDSSPVQVVEASAPELALIAVRPAWVRVSAADGTVLLEKILDAGEQYILPATEEAPILRAGNGGGVYFALNGQAFGPAGRSGAVVKNIELSNDAISTTFAAVDLEEDAHVAEMFLVAQNTVVDAPAE